MELKLIIQGIVRLPESTIVIYIQIKIFQKILEQFACLF